MRRVIALFLVTFSVLACQATGQDNNTRQPARSKTETTFTRGAGGSMVTTLSRNIKVNAKSTLQREWVAAHQADAPVDLVGTPGITTVYKPGEGYASGEYQYNVSIPLDVREDLSAIEIRFVLFDIWGRFTKTLSVTEVEDLVARVPRTLSPGWRVFSESEVSEHYASLAYVARARTKAGKVFEADLDQVLAEARKMSDRFEPSWLDPRPAAPPDSAQRRP